MKREFRFLHTADIHLDSPLKGLRRYQGAPVELVEHATRRALEKMVQLAIDQQVDFVVIAGDLYDGTWPDHNTGLFFSRQMSRLRQASIPVFLIRGNHDAASRVTENLELPDNVVTLTPGKVSRAHHPVLDQLGVQIWGHSYDQPAVLDSVVDQFPLATGEAFHLAILHTALEGEKMHAAYAPCSVDQLRSRGYDYWALGHVHQRRICCRNPWIVFPGNLQSRHIREPEAKGAYIVDVDFGKQCSLAFHSLDLVRWYTCPLSFQEIHGTDQLVSEIRTQLRHWWQSVIEPRQSTESESDHNQLVDIPDGVAVRIILRLNPQGFAIAQRRSDLLVADVRSLLTDVSDGRAWLEKLKWESVGPTSGGNQDSGPRKELQTLAEAAEHDFELQVRLRGAVDDLMKKLPAEIREGLEPLKSETTYLAKRVQMLPGWIDARMDSDSK